MAAPPPYNAEEERKKQLLKTEEKPQKGSRLVGLMKGTAKAGITSVRLRPSFRGTKQ